MSERKKICVITCTRAEYGCLKRLIDLLSKDVDLLLQLVVGGAHLSQNQGYTIQQIGADGFKADAILDYLKFGNTDVDVVKSMALCQSECAEVFERLKPDAIVVLGDRYELLPICSSALVLRIPIVHISGGDVTIGAIDNEIRNAVTMMADVHFAGSGDSAHNIIRMRGNDERVYNVGELGLENLHSSNLLSRQELHGLYGWDMDKKWLLVTLHPETKQTTEYNLQMAESLMRYLSKLNDSQVIVTYANTDHDGELMNKIYQQYAEQSNDIFAYPSLGQRNYNSAMNQAYCVMGNSSSGIIEAPFLSKPVINIGRRQEGRYKSPDIVDVPVCTVEALQDAFMIIANIHPQPDYYWGDGKSSQKMLELIKQYLSK